MLRFRQMKTLQKFCQSLSLVSAEPLWAAIWSVVLLLISYWGASEVARWVWPL